VSDQLNIVLVTTDPQRADLCRREGYLLDTTPFLDTLATDGPWFNRAYCPAPVCCPSRASFLTGRFPSATGVRDNRIDDPPGYDTELFDVLGEAGYRTGCGNNHSHLDETHADHRYEVSHWGWSPRTDEQAESDE
jgi:arylsulfatase A-like enzyme